jgi:Fur family peroxide stress response transcriptional regulator
MWESVEPIEALIRERGLALTPQRRAIVRTLIERGGHWTAAELLAAITGEFPMASRATVYATLALLQDLGAVCEVPGPGAELRFDATPDPHHHFLCTACGELTDVPEEWFPVRQLESSKRHIEVERFRVSAEGRCVRCS